jgi:hypothetical protein
LGTVVDPSLIALIGLINMQISLIDLILKNGGGRGEIQILKNLKNLKMARRQPSCKMAAGATLSGPKVI